MINYYKILGVADFSSSQEIKTAYRKLSKKFHPDVNDGDKFFEEKFKELQNAYEILSNTTTKKIHDDNLKNNYPSGTNSFTEKAKSPEPEKEEQNKSTNTTSEENNHAKSYIRRNVVIISVLSIFLLGLVFLVIDYKKKTKIISPGAFKEANERDTENAFIRYEPSKLNKNDTPNELIKKNPSFFKIGSSKSEVFDAQGTPSRIDISDLMNGEIWYYESSSIKFINNKVTEISNQSGNLKITL